MKVVALYRPRSEFSRTVEEFVREYERREVGRHIDMVDYDSRDGNAMASLYDIMQHPAILVLKDDGSVQKLWEGPELPLIDEVASYGHVYS